MTRTAVTKCSIGKLFWKLQQDLQKNSRVRDDIPAGIYLLKVNNRNSRTSCEKCSKLMSLLLTLNIFQTFF